MYSLNLFKLPKNKTRIRTVGCFSLSTFPILLHMLMLCLRLIANRLAFIDQPKIIKRQQNKLIFRHIKHTNLSSRNQNLSRSANTLKKCARIRMCVEVNANNYCIYVFLARDNSSRSSSSSHCNCCDRA